MPVNLFDANFYRAGNADLASFNDTQVLSHFQNFGLNEGRAFSPFADLNFYRSNSSNSDLAGFNNSQAFNHLQNNGVAEGRQFSPFADINFYLAANPDVAQAFAGNREQAFGHLQNNGVAEGRLFSPFADINFYLAANPDVAQAFGGNRVQALQHFEFYGLNEGRSFSVPFDVNYYRNVHPDLAASGLNNRQLYEHFQTNGLGEERVSSSSFNVKVYLDNNSDLLAAGFNPRQGLDHFVLFGQREGRPGSDYAGNTIDAARSITVGSSPSTFSDFVGLGDTADYYSFSLGSTSNLNVALTGLGADADIELLDGSGTSIDDSRRNSIIPDSINRASLSAGTYFIRVYQFNGDTNYTLNLSTPNPVTNVRYEFTYYYGNGDFYSGYGHTQSGESFYQGQVDREDSTNETGFTGLYYINSISTDSYDLAQDGEVFVNRYFDTETGITAVQANVDDYHLHEGDVDNGNIGGDLGRGHNGLGTETGLAHTNNRDPKDSTRHDYFYLDGYRSEYNTVFARFSRYYDANYLDGNVPFNFGDPNIT